MSRFGPFEYTNYDESLAHIKQSGTLREYQREFECLASRVQDWPESALLGAFIGGLKSELASEVRVYRPKTYSEAVELARLRDDYLTNTHRSSRFESKKGSYMTGEGKIGISTGAVTKASPPGVKRLSWEELQRRREKGLCFNCDERFAPGHKCATKQA